MDEDFGSEGVAWGVALAAPLGIAALAIARLSKASPWWVAGLLMLSSCLLLVILLAFVDRAERRGAGLAGLTWRGQIGLRRAMHEGDARRVKAVLDQHLGPSSPEGAPPGRPTRRWMRPSVAFGLLGGLVFLLATVAAVTFLAPDLHLLQLGSVLPVLFLGLVLATLPLANRARLAAWVRWHEAGRQAK